MADVRVDGPAVERDQEILTTTAVGDAFLDFLTLPAYELID